MSDDVQAVLDGRARWAVVCGDNRELLASLPAAAASAVVGDPPYGTGQWQRLEAGAGSDCRAVHVTEAWDVWEPSWVAEALRVASGPVLVFLPSTKITEGLGWATVYDVPARLLLWVKPDPRPRVGGQPAYGFEPVVALRALTGGGKDHATASAPKQAVDDPERHPHQKPVEILRWLIRLATKPGDLVVDPFGGSGTTGVAALAEGRRVILCEREAPYADLCRRRCEATEHGGGWRVDAPPSLFAVGAR